MIGGVLLRRGLAAALLMAFILVPFALWEQNVETAWVSFAGGTPAQWLFAIGAVVALILDVILPVPSSIVATGSGALLGLELATVVNFVGLELGSLTGYMLGLYAGQPLLKRIIGPEETDRFRTLSGTVTTGMVVLSRPVPVFAEAMAIAAGASEMRIRDFVAATAAANLGLSAAYGYLGSRAASQQSFLIVFLATIIVPALGWLLLHLVKRFQQR